MITKKYKKDILDRIRAGNIPALIELLEEELSLETEQLITQMQSTEKDLIAKGKCQSLKEVLSIIKR